MCCCGFRMRGIFPSFGIVVMLICMSGCHTPRHSNVLIFGTNTRYGIDLGYDTSRQEPNFTLGYKRQEAVWMPLLVNDGKKGLQPKATDKSKDSCQKKYQGEEGSNKDTYSVLASFGADFSGKGKDVEAQSGIAQFFATGLAARQLATSSNAYRMFTSQPAADKVLAQRLATEREQSSVTVEEGKRIVDGLSPENTAKAVKVSEVLGLGKIQYDANKVDDAKKALKDRTLMEPGDGPRKDLVKAFVTYLRTLK